MTERIAVIGRADEEIISFINSSNLAYGGSYPLRQPGISDRELISSQEALLKEHGIKNLSPITPCDTDEERLTLMLNQKVIPAFSKLNPQDQDDFRFWVIDDNLEGLLQAAKNIMKNGIVDRRTLSRLTFIQLGSRIDADIQNKETGIRTVSLTIETLHPKIHPTPAS